MQAGLDNHEMTITAAKESVVLYDRSHWGRLQVSDRDRLAFIHNQSTNLFNTLKPGQGCDTVIVTSTARTLDLVTGYVMDDAVMLLVSPARRESLLKWFDRYIFFGDKVQLTDVTDQTMAVSLIGPESRSLLLKLGVAIPADLPNAHHQPATIAGCPVQVAAGSGLALPGYTIWGAIADAAAVRSALVDAGATVMSDRPWEQLRIEQGRPMPDAELTEEYNPLEAGLWRSVSFNKGCYIGQETIARLDTYKGVKLNLWGIRCDRPVDVGTPVMREGEKIGTVTSVMETVGLAYIRTKAEVQPGMSVQIGESTATLEGVPFVQHDREC